MLSCSADDKNPCALLSDGECTTDDDEGLEGESRDLVMPLKSATKTTAASAVSGGFTAFKDTENGRNVLRVPLVPLGHAGAKVQKGDFFLLSFADGMEYFVQINKKLLNYQGPFENAGHTRATCLTSTGKVVLDEVNWALVLLLLFDSRSPVPPAARVDFMLVADKLIVRCSGLATGDDHNASFFRVKAEDGRSDRAMADDEVLQFRFTYTEVDRLPTAYVNKGLPTICGEAAEDDTSLLGKRPRS
jgi:hypothetical protein